MPDATPFLAAIRAAPDDDAPRLIYADWLDEHGQPERAEFIRVQCELARRELPELRKRESELLAEHHDLFAGTLAAPGLRFRFERGFVAAFGHVGVFQSNQRDEWAYFLRFFQDGTLLSLETFADPARAAEIFRRGAWQLHLGRYEIDAVISSARLRFDIGHQLWPPGSEGVIDKGCVCVDVHLASTGRRFRQIYRLIPIVDMKSFAESPQDAF